MTERTFDSVISALNNMVTQKQVIDPSQWLEAAQYINLFLETERDTLFLLEQKIAQKKCELLETGKSVAEARVRIEATDEYRQARHQKGRIESALETIRLAKLQSRMTSDILRSN